MVRMYGAPHTIRISERAQTGLNTEIPLTGELRDTLYSLYVVRHGFSKINQFCRTYGVVVIMSALQSNIAAGPWFEPRYVHRVFCHRQALSFLVFITILCLCSNLVVRSVCTLDIALVTIRTTSGATLTGYISRVRARATSQNQFLIYLTGYPILVGASHRHAYRSILIIYNGFGHGDALYPIGLLSMTLKASSKGARSLKTVDGEQDNVSVMAVRGRNIIVAVNI